MRVWRGGVILGYTLRWEGALEVLLLCPEVPLPANALSLSPAGCCLIPKAADLLELRVRFFVGLNGFVDVVGIKLPFNRFDVLLVV